MCDCIYAKIHGLINFDYFRAFSSLAKQICMQEIDAIEVEVSKF
jgi:hypothetical protein